MSKLNKLIATLSISLYALTHTHSQYLLSPKIIDDNTKAYLPTSAKLGTKTINSIYPQSLNNLPDTLFLYHPHYKIRPLPVLQYPHNFQRNTLEIQAPATPYVSTKYTYSFAIPSKPKKLAKGIVAARLVTDIPKPQKATFYNTNHKKIATLKLSPLDQKLYTRSTTYATKIPHHKLQDGYIVIQKDTFPISKNDFFQPIYCISAHKGTPNPNQLEFAKKYFTDYAQKNTQIQTIANENDQQIQKHQAKLHQLHDRCQDLWAQLFACRLDLASCLVGQNTRHSAPPLPPYFPPPLRIPEIFDPQFLSNFNPPRPYDAAWLSNLPEGYAQKYSGEIVIAVNVAADGTPRALLIYAAPKHQAYAETLIDHLNLLRLAPAKLDGYDINSAFLLHILL